ncbi:hypothetical protein BD289DRAFT_507560 [Coniella lustricola]|uniref:Uncharacterized protein n=1 Tax=Coniella lustricola TaxID=2025994 RepID=A0A2T3A248_9PEZI|nr:hypothetical protein BD289DRAFT_507560 [Coniella lustricola]
MAHSYNQPVSGAVFCPQNKPPTLEYMEDIRRFIRGNPLLQTFESAILDLPQTWSTYARTNSSIAALKTGPTYTKNIHDWMADNVPLPIPEFLSGILALPLLTIIQTVQYFQYLALRGINHVQFLREVSVGGIQGFCGGLLPALAIAASKDESEVIENAAKSLRIALGVHISAITDPLSISVVGPVDVLGRLKAHAEGEGLPVTQVNLRGKVHNPENQDLASELCCICDENAQHRLPTSKNLMVPVRCNSTGKLIQPGSSSSSLAHEIIKSTLVLRCEWFTLMQGMARDLKAASSATGATNSAHHALAMFGTGRKNCVPAAPFEEIGLRLTKVDCMFKTGGNPGLQLIPSNVGMACYPSNSIAIVGAGLRLPGANNLDELWELVNSGVSRAEKVPASRINEASLNDRWHGNFIHNVDEFDNAFFGISPREALHMDPQQRLLLETAYEALDSCGYLRHHRRDDFDNVGCFIGTTYTEYLENAAAYDTTAYSATGTIRAFQNGKISYHFGWSGPSEAIDTACSSSLVAIHRACRAIQAGECPMALAGGVNIITGIQNFLDLGKAGFLSPTGQCKPFDQSGDGYCRADGVGLVVLKAMDAAVAAGDGILGIIPAVATNHGGLSTSITQPYPRAQIDLFSKVLKQSGLQARHITYVEAHGTGTQVGDPMEIASIRQVLGGNACRSGSAGEMLCLGSLKANVGHSETAAGIGSLMKVLAMLQHRKIPPLAGFQVLNPKIPPLEPDHLHIPRQVLPWDIPFRAALVNSYGAAGSNAALICCEAPRQPVPGELGSKELAVLGGGEASLQYPIFLSAASPESLRSNARALANFFCRTERVPTRKGQINLANVALTLFQRRQHHKFRWVGTEGSLGSLAQTLQNEASLSQKIYKMTEEASVDKKAVVLMFSGQSKQNIQLDARWYYSWFPRFRFHMDQCQAILQNVVLSDDESPPDILPVLFQREPISDVVALQCGTFAVQYACAKTWIDAGVEVAAVVGHSFGELTAMVVAGVLSLHDGLRLVASRAALMRDKWGPERGAMLAIHTTVDEVQQILSETRDAINRSQKGLNSTLEIACFNGPKSQVVVGTATEVEALEAVMAKQGSLFKDIQRQRIAVSHGFHSAFTQALLADLGQVGKSLTFNKPVLHLETCTERPLENNLLAPARILEHTRAPVYFSQAVARLEDRLGSCIWLEAGANSPIISMVKRAVVHVTRHTYIPVKTAPASSNNSNDNINDISSATTILWRENVPATFWGFQDTRKTKLKPVWLPPYQFAQKRYWLDWINAASQESNKSPQADGSSGFHEFAQSRLVTPLGRRKGHSESSSSMMEFAIGTKTKRFTDIVSSHAIRGHPLCPASIYMECVVMAVQMVKSETSFQTCKFEDISFQSGLGLAQNRNVFLTIHETGGCLAWNFAFSSSPIVPSASSGHKKQESVFDNEKKNNGGGERAVHGRPIPATNHAKGRFSIVVEPPVDFHLLERIMLDRIQQLLADPRAEKLNASRAYSLFSRVVDYGLCLRGISRIAILRSHAVAQVQRPDTHSIDTKGSTAVSVADTVMSDVFIQVLGLLINSSEACPQDEVYIATGIESVVMQECNFDACREWTVYAMASPGTVKDNVEVSGDILVFTGQGKLIMTGTGIRFSRHAITKLEKILERNLGDTGGRASAVIPTDKQPVYIPLTPSYSSSSDDDRRDEEKFIDARVATTVNSNPATSTRSQLLELISNNCGSPLDTIEDLDGTSIEAFGVDSLSMVELISSLEESFGVSLGEDEFNLSSTVTDVLMHLEAGFKRQ